MSERGVRRALVHEDRLAGEELEEDRAERVDVTLRVGGAAADDLGRHRLRRAEDREEAGVAVRCSRADAKAIGAEVDEDDPRLTHVAGPARDEDVLRLHVAVDEVRLVQRGERLEDPLQDRAELVVRDGARAGEARRERLAVDVLVRHVVDARLDLAGLDVPGQARVVDRCR